MTTIHFFPAMPGVRRHPSRRRIVVLGTNEIASAIAVFMTRNGARVVMSHDPMPPVIRRRMAFHDSLYGELTSVQEVYGVNCDHVVEILEEMTHGSRVVVTRLGLSHLLPIGGFDAIIDARMHKAATMPMLRYLAPMTIGLGPGFVAGENCDIAVETHPDFVGQILTAGETLSADGVPSVLGDLRQERFVYSHTPGRWSTHREIDPRGRNALCHGIDQRSSVIAQAVLGSLVVLARNR